VFCKKILTNYKALLEHLDGAIVILLGPTPRYMLSKDAVKKTHVEDFKNEDFKKDIISGTERIKR
jgi:hypothetical protein